MDSNQQQSANHIIEYLKEIDVDGETIQYITDALGISDQLLKQLFLQADDLAVNNLIEERDSIHDRGNNTQFY